MGAGVGATREDVVECYRHFLRREPESEEAVARHLAGEPTLWDLVRRFEAAPEARQAAVKAPSADMLAGYDPRGNRPAASRSDAVSLLEHVKSVWSRYGERDAYYSVLTESKYLAENLGDGDIDAFYATGQYDADLMLKSFERNDIAIDTAWEILDFGCGVGRIGEHLSRRFSKYAGVDISAGHLAIASRRFREHDVANASLVTLSNYLAHPFDIDILFSVIAFQHNPPPVMEMLLDVLLGRVRPGGYAYFQMPCHLYNYEFSVEDYLAGRGRLEVMEMHALPQDRVFALLARHGLRPIEVLPDPRIGDAGYSFTFFAEKARAAAGA